MLKGIDVSSAQAGISFNAVKAAGYSWCVVKMGGFNITPEYVAPRYHEQVDGARAAGLKVGHYWLIGSGNAAQEADYFAANLYHLDKAHDILALDDERLDANATFWTDGNVAAFFTELHKKTGVPYRRMWFYVGGYNASANTWTKTKALGVRTWIASYGANDGAIHPADTGGKLPVDVQQFTSNGRIPGVSGVIDLSYSNLAIADLFSDPAPAPIPTPAPAPVPTPAPASTLNGSAMYIKTNDGSIWAINPIAETKHHIVPAAWHFLSQFDHQVVSVTDVEAALYKSV